MFKSGRGDRQAGFAPDIGGMSYLDFLEILAAKRETRNYLEIGVHYGDMLARIACDTALGIDPGFILAHDVTQRKRRTLLYRCTSDSYFAGNDTCALLGGGLDLAFLDGLHQFEFLLRDFYNTEAACDPNGLIVLHDCMPLNVEMTTRDPEAPRTDGLSGMWTGDVWKLVPILREHRPDLDIHLVDCQPTGLVCVTGLDPTSRVLRDRYRTIVRSQRNPADPAAAIAAMYAAEPILRSADILNGADHSLYFRL